MMLNENKKTITIPAPKFPPFSTTSAPLPPNDNDH